VGPGGGQVWMGCDGDGVPDYWELDPLLRDMS
jgi:hypothetical protein